MKKILIIFFCLFILSTTYGQWFWQNPLPQGNDLYSVHFINSNTGWMVGEVGTILRTTDGGSTWENQVSGSKKMLRSQTTVGHADTPELPQVTVQFLVHLMVV